MNSLHLYLKNTCLKSESFICNIDCYIIVNIIIMSKNQAVDFALHCISKFSTQLDLLYVLI